MWNYYSKGNAYEGFNIGMDIPSIEDSLHMMYGHQLVNVDIYSIVYDSVKQEKMIEDFLREVLAVYQEGDLPCLRYIISHQLTYWSLIFKSQFFQHEEEVRIIVHVAKNRKEDILQNDPIDIKYRINGGYIIPFIEMKLDKSVVCSVSLGPLQCNEEQKKKQQEILQEMLKKYGYLARVMCSQIPVRY